MTAKKISKVLPAVLLCAFISMSGCADFGSDQDRTKSEVTESERPKFVPGDYEKMHDEGLYVKYKARGEGDELNEGDVAIFHYHGKRADLNKTFENTYEAGLPMAGEVGQKQLMPALNFLFKGARIGDEFLAYVPPTMGYGRFIVNKVPAGTTLFLNVQLIGKKKPVAPFDTEGLDAEEGVLGLKVVKVLETDGKKPVQGDLVKLHYNGYFAESGKKFDSSHDRNVPIVFNILSGEVIQGMDAAVRSMREGEKARVYIPYSYAYGENGRQNIPGKTDLIFDIHLFSVEEEG